MDADYDNTTSSSPKVMRVFVSKRLENICQTLNGFRKKRSTLTQLLSFFDEVNHTSNFNVPSAAVYFELSKAFDSVRHDIILNKLSMYGFDHDFLLLFSTYLCNRSQYVRSNAHIFNPRPVTSGVPQGSIL